MERLRKVQQSRPGGAPAASGPLLRIGFVPLNDCAPLVVAQELGFFARHNLRVRLSRELGWATIRAKLAYGELDAAHAPCGLPFALHYGFEGLRAPCCTGLVLNLNGNAITLSRRLWDDGVRDAASLAARQRRPRSTPLILGAVSRHSTHVRLLQRWLGQAGLVEGQDFRIVFVPPPQMWSNLRAGHLDGYCVGEPWNSAAILAGDGWCAATSCSLAPRHPEKVLAVRKVWADANPDTHQRLAAAVLEACRVCDDPSRREGVVQLLARRDYLDLPADRIRPAWSGDFPVSRSETQRLPEFNCFHRFDTNEPGPEKAAWVMQELFGHLLLAQPSREELGTIFRMDVFEAARLRASASFNPSTQSNPDHESQTLPA